MATKSLWGISPGGLPTIFAANIPEFAHTEIEKQAELLGWRKLCWGNSRLDPEPETAPVAPTKRRWPHK